MSFLKKRLQSFEPPIHGVAILFRETPNARVELAIAIAALVFGFCFHLSAGEWTAILVLIGAVFSLEAVNTAIERLADYACGSKYDPLVKKAKDLAAAAVLIMACTSVIVGLYIFIPKITGLP